MKSQSSSKVHTKFQLPTGTLWAVSIAVLVCTLAGGLWQVLANGEPYYEGKPFSYWLDQIPCTIAHTNLNVSIMYPWIMTRAGAGANQMGDMDKSNKALKIVDQIGGQCLPMLLRRLQSRDSPLKERLVQWSVRMHLMPASWTPRRSDMMRAQSLTAIIKLGYSAKPLFPALEVLAHDKDPNVKAAARCALMCLNPAEFSRLERLQSGKH